MTPEITAIEESICVSLLQNHKKSTTYKSGDKALNKIQREFQITFPKGAKYPSAKAVSEAVTTIMLENNHGISRRRLLH